MGLSPDQVRRATIYDLQLMAKALGENSKHDFNVMRHNAYLVSVYSMMEEKARRKLSPQKMYPFKGEKQHERLSKEEVKQILDRSNRRRGIC